MSIDRELARRRPADIVTQPKTTDATIVARPLHLWRLAGWIALVIGAVLFAGLLLSLMQQNV